MDIDQAPLTALLNQVRTKAITFEQRHAELAGMLRNAIDRWRAGAPANDLLGALSTVTGVAEAKTVPLSGSYTRNLEAALTALCRDTGHTWKSRGVNGDLNVEVTAKVPFNGNSPSAVVTRAVREIARYREALRRIVSQNTGSYYTMMTDMREIAQSTLDASQQPAVDADARQDTACTVQSPTPADDLVLYILVRNDLASLNHGKACAQAAHAANECVAHLYANGRTMSLLKQWMEGHDGNFGTTIVLAGNWQAITDSIATVERDADHRTVSGRVLDPTYPVTDGDVKHAIPLETCAWVFGSRAKLQLTLLSGLKLMP